MKPSIKIALLVYVIVMIGCIVAFYVQKTIVYSHIRTGQENARSPIAVSLKDKDTGEKQNAEITFLDHLVIYNPASMGNEIEEHLLSLMAANFATGVLLLFIIVTSSKNNM